MQTSTCILIPHFRIPFKGYATLVPNHTTSLREGLELVSEELLSAIDAARRFGRNQRTANRRAQEAFDRGDPVLRRVGRMWIAPASWWERTLAEQKQMGRPRKNPQD